MSQTRKANFFLRIGIAFSFFYVAISSFINPTSWIGYFPKFLQTSTILVIFSIYEIMLAILLISNKKTFEASILSTFTMFSIIIFNFGAMDIIFRDVSILFASIALALLSKK